MCIRDRDWRSATQTRALGGEGLCAVASFLGRVERHLAHAGVDPPDRLRLKRLLATTNTLTALAYCAPPPPPERIITFWTCGQCRASVPSTADFFESHGVRVCSPACLRAFRSSLSSSS